MCDSDCIEWLKTQAMQYQTDADKAARSPRTRPNEPALRRRFTALGWAAGELTQHQAQQRKTP